MGRLTLTELAYLLVTRREPTDGQRRILDAVLVSLADHGLTPSALGGPPHLHGRAGSGPGRDRGRLARRGQRVPRPDRRHRPVPRRHVARAAPTARRRRDAADRRGGRGRARRAAGRACRGSGIRCTRIRTRAHPGSTSSPAEEGCSGRTCGCLGFVAAVHEERTGPAPADQRRRRRRRGARRSRHPTRRASAASCSSRAPPGSSRHLAEEVGDPIGMPLWLEVERRAGA